MDFARDAILMSHMGEGNWALARADDPGEADQATARDRRPRGSADLPVPAIAIGAATLATLVALGDERFRLVVCEGEILDSDELPALEMPYGFFRPDTGLRRLHRRLASIRRPPPPGPEPGAQWRPSGASSARPRGSKWCSSEVAAHPRA